MKYNFKSMTVIPKANELIDVVLTRTQRKTPTVIHPGYEISRIRNFYKRKIKFTQSTIHEKLTQLLEEFPRLDDIHPFYADLINVLYDKDHYKLALGQINTANHLVSQIADNYVRLIKYADSLYRCKQLKRAALGRMCTLLKKQGPSLAYLEEVRKHLSRLPSIDPTTRTLLICGFPNVGKSSFMNKVTRANVDVQPYAFTTKSLFVGHLDYQYLRWQVIDTPGILDHDLEERNTIEMQSITALAHLQCAILYFIDISCECGYTIEQQLSLFNNIKPLFIGKPLFLICNKIDVMKFEDLKDEYKQQIEEATKETNAHLMKMSGLEEIGVMEVKNAACEELLKQRVEKKLGSEKASSILNKLHVAFPKARDNKIRSVCIPESVLKLQEQGALTKTVYSTGRTGRLEKEQMEEERDKSGVDRRKSQKEIQWEHGGPGIYSMDDSEHYKGMLETDEWIHDIIPQIMDGKNIVDFYDPEIEKKLAALEEEEEKLQNAEMEEESNGEDDVDSDTMEMFETIQKKKKIIKERNEFAKVANHPKHPRTKKILDKEEVVKGLEENDIETEGVMQRRGKKRTRSVVRESEEETKKRIAHKTREPMREDGFVDEDLRHKAKKLKIRALKPLTREGRSGESDRRIGDTMPRHLNSGHRGIGKTDRR